MAYDELEFGRKIRVAAAVAGSYSGVMAAVEPRQAMEEEERRRLEALAARVRRRPGDFTGISDLAAAAGVTAPRLRELVRRHHHDTPSRLLVRARVEQARRRLLTSGRPEAEIARRAGFASLASFESAFRRLTAMTPAAYRRLPGADRFALRLPASFQLERTLAYLGRDPGSRTERVRGRRYEAGLWVAGLPVRLDAELAPGRVRCRLIAAGPLPAGAAVSVHGQLVRRLGLSRDPAPFEAAVAADPRLAALVDGRRGLRVPLTFEPFDCLTWAIVGQQVNLAFACSMVGRLVERAGTAVGEGLWAPPPAAAVASLGEEDLRQCRFSRQKIDYLLGAARRVAAGDLDLAALAAGSAESAEERLGAVRGLGPWSVGYVMMRGLGLADCLPVGDAGLVRALTRFFALEARPSAQRTRELMEPFRPFRSFATFHLWQRLEDPP